jgi:hypothetical protein
VAKFTYATQAAQTLAKDMPMPSELNPEKVLQHRRQDP